MTLLEIYVMFSYNKFELWQGNLVPRASTFGSGIKALADYVHRRGLKLGIYSDAGYYHYFILFVIENIYFKFSILFLNIS